MPHVSMVNASTRIYQMVGVLDLVERLEYLQISSMRGVQWGLESYKIIRFNEYSWGIGQT